MKKTLDFYVGIILVAFGLLWLLSNTYVFSYGFNYTGHFQWSGLLLIVMIFCLAIYIIKPNKFVLYALAAIAILFVISLCTSLRFNFKRMSLFKLLGIICCLGTGLGLIIRDLLN